MNNVIRKGCFETNSSSVHTLVISKEGLEPSNLKIEKNGKIRVPLRYWGKEYEEYTSQLDKLSYICTRAWYANGGRYDRPYAYGDEGNYILGLIEEAICDYTGAKGLELYIPPVEDENWDEYPGFDHQTAPEYSDDMNEFCNVWNPDSILNFVFNKYISFTTGCD